MLSSDEMVALSHIEVNSEKLYQFGKHEPVRNGCLDLRLVFLLPLFLFIHYANHCADFLYYLRSFSRV